MKGIVFTEFAEMVENSFDADMMDDLIDATDPASGGAYTTIGTYDYNELINMVVELSNRTEIPVPKLVNTFGHHLGKVFAEKYSAFFQEADCLVDFLKSVDNHIHVEVKKLYPDAELPEFTFDDSSEGEFYLNYSSSRHLADLAHGLIEETCHYYGENWKIERSDKEEGSLQKSQFKLSKLS